MKGTNLNPTIISRLRENTAGPQGLHFFDLTNSNVGPRELTLLADTIKYNFQSTEGIAPLISIDLSGNQLCGVDSMSAGAYDSDGFNDFNNMLVAMSKISRLRKINFSRNFLDIKGFTILSTLLNNGPSSLLELHLKSCCANNKAVEKLMEGMKNNRSIFVLDLSQNEFGNEGAEYIAEMLTNNRRLRQLSITECGITGEGATLIAKSLVNNVALEVLNIADNSIGDVGAEAFGTTLKTNNCLKHLDLQENRITNEGVAQLGKGIQRNRSLVYIGLQWNDLTNEGADRFSECLVGNTSLKAVSILGNHIDYSGLASIIQGSLTGSQKPIDVDLGFAYNFLIANQPTSTSAGIISKAEN